MSFQAKVSDLCRECATEITSERIADILGVSRFKVAEVLYQLHSNLHRIERTGSRKIEFVRSNGRPQRIDTAVYRWVGT